MRRGAAYAGLAAVAACAPAGEGTGWVLYPPAPEALAMADAPLAEKLSPRRFAHEDRVVYLAELRDRRSAGQARSAGYDIAISREGVPFSGDHAARGEAGPVAVAYCAALGGRHDDGAAAVFYPARRTDDNAEWVFPRWCRLPEVAT